MNTSTHIPFNNTLMDKAISTSVSLALTCAAPITCCMLSIHTTEALANGALVHASVFVCHPCDCGLWPMPRPCMLQVLCACLLAKCVTNLSFFFFFVMTMTIMAHEFVCHDHGIALWLVCCCSWHFTAL